MFELPDGRALAWTEYGVRDGAPVFAFHGSPGTCLHFAGLSDVAGRRGTRLIATDRPGYGRSTYDPGRTYTSWARDVGGLADHLGVDRFGVIGYSSGGPNAAACARFLGDRVVSCAIVSGPAPPEARIAETATLRSNRIAERLSRVTPRATGFAFQAGLRQAGRAPDKMFEWMRRTLPVSDVAVVERADIRAALEAEMTHRLARTAGRAAVQDLRLERVPWGFRLGDIAVAVHVWHGGADRNVPIANGLYQASAIPHSTLHHVPDAGHWLLYDHFDDILACMGASA